MWSALGSTLHRRPHPKESLCALYVCPTLQGDIGFMFVFDKWGEGRKGPIPVWLFWSLLLPFLGFSSTWGTGLWSWSLLLLLLVILSSVVAQSCLTLFDPMNYSTPGLPVHHQLPEFTQIHVHQVGDAIQPSHPPSSPSPPAPSPSQHQGLFQWVNSSHEVAKVLLLLLYVPLICPLKKCWLLANGEVPCWPLKKTQSLA